VAVASGKYLLLSGDTIIPNNLTMPLEMLCSLIDLPQRKLVGQGSKRGHTPAVRGTRDDATTASPLGMPLALAVPSVGGTEGL
jgi:hypothetical protein